MNIFNTQSKAGFTLLFASLVTSLLLSVGLAIFNISIKELILSTAGRDSQLAFYAADTGRECALYWDAKNDAFNPDTDRQITCDGNVIQLDNGDKTEGVPTEFGFNFGANASYTEVEITKHIGSVPQVCTELGFTSKCTVLFTHGFNTSDNSSSRRVERSIEDEF